MNIEQLKYLIEIVEEKSFSIASEKLHISQPALSQSIKSLEKELNIEIFSRKPLKLTYAGEVFTKWAKKVILSENQLIQEIADIIQEKESKIVIGIATHRSTYILPKVILQFQKEFPKCKIILEEHSSDILKELMDNEKIDLLIDIPNTDKNLYQNHLITTEKILLVTPSNWNLEFINNKENYPIIDLSILKNKPFIFLTQSQYIGKISRNLCNQNGFDPQIILECHNIETIYSMIVSEMGASFIPELFIKNNVNKKDVNIYQINNFNLEREIAIVYRKDKYISKPIKRFIELLSKNIKHSKS